MVRMSVVSLFQGVKAAAYGAVAYKLCDQGLSRALVLEELTHGTDPISNLKIRCFGGQPSKPGYKPNYPYPNTVGYFYLYKDSEFAHVNGKIPDWKKKLTLIDKIKFYGVGKPLEKWLRLMDNISNAFVLKGQRYFQIPIEELTKQMPLVRAVGVFGCILSPTLRFRFATIDQMRLEEDTNHPGFAYKTSQVVEPWRLGPMGSCLTGLNFDLGKRVMDNPVKSMIGVSELAVGVALLFFKGVQMRAKLPFAIAGALFA